MPIAKIGQRAPSFIYSLWVSPACVLLTGGRKMSKSKIGGKNIEKRNQPTALLPRFNAKTRPTNPKNTGMRSNEKTINQCQILNVPMTNPPQVVRNAL